MNRYDEDNDLYRQYQPHAHCHAWLYMITCLYNLPRMCVFFCECTKVVQRIHTRSDVRMHVKPDKIKPHNINNELHAAAIFVFNETTEYSMNCAHGYISFVFAFITATSNDRYGVSNCQSIECLFDNLFKFDYKGTSKVRVAVPSWGESTGDRWIPCTKG